MSTTTTSEDVLICPAIRFYQEHDCPLFLFSLEAEKLFQVADVARLSRMEDGGLTGYQRPRAKRQVQDIARYLGAGNALLPSSLTLALSPAAVRFEVHAGDRRTNGAVSGTLTLPLPPEGEEKPGCIVDGQQRAIALSQAGAGDFPVPVSAFLSDEESVQREQFVRLNSTNRLPRGLVTEILPLLDGPLPPKLEAKKTPSALCEWLSRDPSSPLQGLIRRASTPKRQRRKAVVADMPLVSTIQQSLSSPSGCLFSFHNLATGEVDVKGARRMLSAYWTAVRNTFPDAWGRPPNRSRLMHSAGIRIMSRFMDYVAGPTSSAGEETAHEMEAELQCIASACHWTEGYWDVLGGLRWNDLKSTPRHIRPLVRHLKDAHMDKLQET